MIHEDCDKDRLDRLGLDTCGRVSEDNCFHFECALCSKVNMSHERYGTATFFVSNYPRLNLGMNKLAYTKSEY